MSAATAPITTAGPRGPDDWSYAHVLPYFRRQESWEGGAERLSRRRRPADDASARAIRTRWSRPRGGRRGGRPSRRPRLQRRAAGGLWPLQMTIRDGRRCSAAVAYLRPALARANLTVEIGALATRHRARQACARSASNICATARRSRARRARGDPRGRRHQLAAAADAVRHRRPGALRAHGIAGRVPLPGVGQNLQDHSRSHSVSRRRSRGRCTRCGSTASRSSLRKAYLRRHAASRRAARRHYGLPEEPLPIAAARHPVAVQRRAAHRGALFPAVHAPFVDGFGCRAVVLRPESRGHLELASRRSAAGAAHPPEFLRDARRTGRRCATASAGARGRRAKRRSRRLSRRRSRRARSAADAEIDAHIRATAITVHHPLGTCRMGADRDAGRWSMPSCGCAGSRGCASSTPRSCRISSAATSTRRSS